MGNVESFTRFGFRFAGVSVVLGALGGLVLGVLLKKSQIAQDGFECVLGEVFIFTVVGAVIGLLLGFLGGATSYFLVNTKGGKKEKDRATDRYKDLTDFSYLYGMQ